MTSDLDVVVIGAGAAGLAAARAAQESGLAFVLIEASGRAGGRAFTDRTSFGAPFDDGCHWLHSASINPFTALADRYGFGYRRAVGQRRIHDGAGWLSGRRFARAAGFIDEAFAAVHAAGAAGRDIAAAAAVDGGSPHARLFHRSFTGYMAAEPELVSVFDTSRYRDTGENWPVTDGFGALVLRHGVGLPIALDCPATAIDWSGRRLRIATARGTLTARAIILTPSTGVLAAGRIRFTPALPAWKQEAIAALPMGSANKIAFAFATNPFGDVVPHFALLDGAGDQGAAIYIDPPRRPQATLFLGGAEARALELAGPAAMLDHGRERLAAMFGADILRRITASRSTAWQGDPWFAGAYAVTRPGRGEAREALIRPVEDRLFFAGEAASLDSFSTAHGAHLSGIAALAATRAALGR